MWYTLPCISAFAAFSPGFIGGRYMCMPNRLTGHAPELAALRFYI